MNREIKFRGMSVSGEWHCGFVSRPNMDMLGGAKKDHYYISNRAGSPFAFEVRPETVGQYTGLKDKNGKEIYEGDIVAFSDTEMNFQVEYLGASFVFQHVSADAAIEYLLDKYASYIEVLGNKFDTPKLLNSR